MRILLDKILKSKVGCPPKFFSKLKNIHIEHEKPRPKVFLNTFFTLENTLSFFFEFFLHFFHGLYVYFLVFKKILVDNQLFFSRFCPIKSSFNDISYLDMYTLKKQLSFISYIFLSFSSFFLQILMPSWFSRLEILQQ